MCITITNSITACTPLKQGNIRWKAMKFYSGKPLVICSGIAHDIWFKKKWKKAKKNNFFYDSSADIGFHVFLTKSDAINYVSEKICPKNWVIVKVEVVKHHRSGAFGYDLASKCETWKRARFLEVFTSSGRHNITKRFK